MHSKISLPSIQNKRIRDLDSLSKEHPTLDDLIRDQNNLDNEVNTVHHRRDLDSLG